ncbi:MAG TPA: hypothetical protein VL907_06990, partial [Pyrinomonadaceae bacterium]|nr:hypothetical protein [Pyrinomonadaceae bacterium]
MKLRRTASFFCAIALLASAFAPFASIQAQQAARTAQAPKAAPAQAKRPLTHNDYDSWRSIQAPQISRDGKFVAYAYVPQDGDGDIIVRNIASGVEWRAPRGYRPPVPPPDDPGANIGEFVEAQARLLRPLFTADTRFVVFGTEPTKAEVAKAKKEKKKPEDMPKNGLGIMDLADGTVTRIDRVKSFRVPEDEGGFIAYLMEAASAAPPAPASSDKPAAPAESPQPQPSPPARRPAGKKKEYGSELVLRNTSTGSERKFSDVLDFTISKDAKSLVFTTSARKEETNGVFAVITTAGDSAPVTLLTGKGKYQRLTWDEDNTQLAFISDKEDADAKQPKFRVYQWNRKDPLATEVVSVSSTGFRKDLVVSERANLNFSLDGSHLFLGTAPPPEPERNPDEEIPADEKVLVDLWHWKDDYIQPIQRVRAEQERNRSYRAVYDLKEKKFVQLADESMENISPSNDGSYAIGSDNRKYRVMNDYDPGFSDFYLVNTSDGSRKAVQTKQRGNVSLSPNAKYAIYFDGKDWFSYSVASANITNLTKSINANFYNELNDLPATPGSYGIAGWTKDDADVLIYDRYDIWQLAPDGSRTKNLTDGVGRKEKTTMRYVRLDPRERWIDPDKPMLLQAENEDTRDSGFYREKVNSDL